MPSSAAYRFAQDNAQQSWSDDVYRLYQATLDREPDLAGFSNWTGRLADGMSYLEVADGFVQSPQFMATYQNLSNAEFVNLLYNNVLDRAADAMGLANWTGRLDGGMTRAEVVQGFAQSAEFVAETAADVANWIRAQGQDDLLTAGAAENLLAGGMLSDTFAFVPNTSDSTVLDLEAWDSVDLRAFDYDTDAEARSYFSQQGGMWCLMTRWARL
ncbi:DUF4214 domain-containing protein [Phaeobacter sp. J2-8]|uniref:DUF4214 domain-containing protein n=1 Tax=Phaeobacter sp. J2-8 TaxID=2931394 RepID=UPI001FD2350E|nr:DUF4214 domain-containing protein [Phaeobacter sp. J2-8]